jgi:DNA-binding transcriptional regulator YhcF (GntR family)
MTLLKFERVAASVRTRIANGTLRPGEPAPSAAALARDTGVSALTCRKALGVLIEEGTLTPGPSRNARPRVPVSASTLAERSVADAERALSASLAERRRALGLTQPQFAAALGVSVTTVGHAETGRLWQSRRFWEKADSALRAHGELLKLHDAHRTATVLPDAANAETTEATFLEPHANPATVACVVIVWSDGKLTTVIPSATAMRRRRPGLVEANGTSRDVSVASVNVPRFAGSVRSHERSPMGR